MKNIIALAMLITATNAFSGDFDDWAEPVMQDYIYQQQQLTNQRRFLEIQNRQLQLLQEIHEQKQYEPEQKPLHLKNYFQDLK